MFLMWLGEQITQRGVGNGISLIIFAGIVANLPKYGFHPGTWSYWRAFSVNDRFPPGGSGRGNRFRRFMERAQRRIIIRYPKRQQGNKMFEGQSSHLPLKINTSGLSRRFSHPACC